MKVTFVESARKDYPNHGIKKGDSYYWWTPYRQGKRYSKTRPTASQLESNPTMSTFLELQERVNAFDVKSYENGEDIAVELEEIHGEVESVRDEFQEKFDNMPEGLQQGDIGQQLEQRANGCDTVADSVTEAADDIRQKWETFVDEYGGEEPDDTLGKGTWVLLTKTPRDGENEILSVHNSQALAELARDEYLQSFKATEQLPDTEVKERPFKDADEWQTAWHECLTECIERAHEIEWDID